MLTPDVFELAAQPSVMLAALQGKTKFNYLQGRKAEDVVLAALSAAKSGVYHAPTIKVPGEDPIPYSNRGTYIQVIELLPSGPSGRNVFPPGVTASGPHSRDQVNLSRAWLYKPMHLPKGS
jgi:penicillin amidase